MGHSHFPSTFRSILSEMFCFTHPSLLDEPGRVVIAWRPWGGQEEVQDSVWEGEWGWQMQRRSRELMGHQVPV